MISVLSKSSSTISKCLLTLNIAKITAISIYVAMSIRSATATLLSSSPNPGTEKLQEEKVGGIGKIPQ